MEDFIYWCERNKWKLELINTRYISPIVLQSNVHISELHIKFLQSIAKCDSADECVWFLCNGNYDGTTDYDFRWNEFEAIMLEGADMYDDEETRVIAKKFWAKHLPIVYSVRGYYSFYAVDIDGRIVYGAEPEFESVSIVAETFEEFIKMLINGDIEL